jgi:hypothetical protein
VQAAALELAIELPDVRFDRGSFEPQPELADRFAKDAANFRIEGLELGHS